MPCPVYRDGIWLRVNCWKSKSGGRCIVIARAGGPLGGALGTLDAIHLVTAMLWSTHDRQLANAARVCGLTVYPDSIRHPVGH
jgi:hypothetical protein